LFNELGWDDLINNGNYHNTCAIRVSLSLIKSGMLVSGRMAIKKGPHKGKIIEPGQGALANILARPSMFGTPEKFKNGKVAERAIAGLRGLIAFFRLHPDVGDTIGHIDLVGPGASSWGELVCAGACYWQSGEVWFWPLR